MIDELLTIFVYIVMPGLTGILFVSLAKFVKHIAPLRALVANSETYTAAFWGFAVFGLYFGLRVVQVFAGPHPWPLIISTIREFLLMAVFVPSAFVGMITLCVGPEKMSKARVYTVFGASLAMAILFCGINAKAIGGSEEIVKLGMMTAYDGLWFKSGKENAAQLMKILMYIRLVNPVLLLLVAATVVMVHAKRYPENMRKLYDNMPRKLMILSSAVYVYALSMVVGYLIYGLKMVPDQIWIYHLGSLVAGFLEAFSLAMPVRSNVQVSEHG